MGAAVLGRTHDHSVLRIAHAEVLLRLAPSPSPLPLPSPSPLRLSGRSAPLASLLLALAVAGRR